jgi:hypothetical protein
MEHVPEASTAGLCSTCYNNVDAACSYRALRGFDAQVCDMYDDRTPASVLLTSASGEPSARVVVTTRPAPPESTVFKGLCVNCENRETCVMARAEGGIWHCEEYR